MILKISFLKLTLSTLFIIFTQYCLASSIDHPIPEINLKVETVQDTLYLKDGRILTITYISETPMKVKFKKTLDGSGRSWTKDKSAIDKIVMSDGTVKTYSSFDNQNNQQNQNSPEEIKKAGRGIAIGLVIALLLVAVLVGLIALIASL